MDDGRWTMDDGRPTTDSAKRETRETTDNSEEHMSQTIAIILRFREGEADRFEELFRAEVYPLWQEFKAQGKFITASLTPVHDGSEIKEGVRDYILHVEVPGMAE